MKTSDLELSGAKGSDGKKSKSGAMGVAGLFDWLLPKAKTKKKKFKMGTLPSSPAIDTKTKVSQSSADVVALLKADGVRRVAVHGDQAFYETFRAEAGGIDTVWMSTDIFGDQPKGAMPVAAATVADCDAVVVGGPDAATKYRYSLRLALTHAATKPVHWVAQNWEFCAGTAAIPLEIDDVDALAFNHFEEFFGIKDPIQFRFEIIAEGETRRSYLVLGPSQSVNLNLRSLMADRKSAVCMKVFVAHPFLTRGRHYRFRVCADVFWKDSFTIIHGSHQFSKNPNKVQPFRLIDSVVRNGEVVMTVPNYDLDMGSDDEVKIGMGSGESTLKRARHRPVEEVHFNRSGPPATDRRYFAASYAGYGTSFWYALDQGFSQKPGKIASIAANHLCRVEIGRAHV